MPEEKPQLTEQQIIDSLAVLIAELMENVQKAADGLGIDGKQFHILNVVTASLYSLLVIMHTCTTKQVDDSRE